MTERNNYSHSLLKFRTDSDGSKYKFDLGEGGFCEEMFPWGGGRINVNR